MEIKKCKRLGRVTTFEATWLRVLGESDLDLSKPFTAKDAYAHICQGKNRQGLPLRAVPATHSKVFALLKKSGNFDQTRDSSGASTWVASE